ncbi:hypothetical protein R6Z07F_003166 [Ovis aries]
MINWTEDRDDKQILQIVVSNRGNIDWKLLIQKIKRKKPEHIINPLRTQYNKLYHFNTSLNSTLDLS